jgi:hypothetical protein
MLLRRGLSSELGSAFVTTQKISCTHKHTHTPLPRTHTNSHTQNSPHRKLLQMWGWGPERWKVPNTHIFGIRNKGLRHKGGNDQEFIILLVIYYILGVAVFVPHKHIFLVLFGLRFIHFSVEISSKSVQLLG